MCQSCQRVAIALLLAALLPIAAAAQAPAHLNHQGILTDSNGVVVPDGQYQLEFGIYDAAAAGTLHFEQQLTVNVLGGLYNVLLSDNGTQVLKDAFDEPNRYLQIRIVTSPGGAYDGLVLEPRQQIASVPYAFRADSAGVSARNFAFLRGYIDGFQLSKSAARVLQIGAGGCRDSANEYGLLADSAWTKDLGAEWAPGDGAGGRAEDVPLADDKWYHVFLIYHPASKAIDFGFDDQIDASNLLAGTGVYTHYRRLGSILTDGSSNIRDFFQRGDEFLWYDPPLYEYDGGFPYFGPYEALAPLSVPPGVSVLANLSVLFNFSAGGQGVTARCYVNSPDALSEEPSGPGTPTPQFKNSGLDDGSGQIIARTNTSGEIRYRCSDGNYYNPVVQITTVGWWDPRGRDE